MTLADLGNLGELIGAFAVVVSLLYLAAQIRQNTRQLGAGTFQDLSRGWQDWTLTMAQDESSQLWVRGAEDFESLDRVEATRFTMMVRSYLRGYENAYYQYRQGTFDTEAWEGYRVALGRDTLRQPGFLAIWERDRALFDATFARFVDAEIAKRKG